MKFTDAEQHAASLNLLREVRDFIATWPPHPMRGAMVDRIDAHLTNPTSKLVQMAQHPRKAERCTPAGKRVLEARLIGDELTLRRPGSPNEWVDDAKLLRHLANGETMQLTPDTSCVILPT